MPIIHQALQFVLSGRVLHEIEISWFGWLVPEKHRALDVDAIHVVLICF
jgi:hypothetical protein